MEVKSVEDYMERIRVIDALEQQAMGLSRMLTTYTDRLQERLEQRMAIEQGSEAVVLRSIKHLEAAVTKSVQQKQSLIQKCHQLDGEMQEVQVVSSRLQEIKQLLDVLEYSTRKD
ncbi:hypothetical protein LPJ63_004067 [Coemansia sp. RSA 2711]|nr:hypothetical protein LPJ63_004067 [Coemansia sp. RSA 2711]KAJ1839646.1 hypothetical protein LPJ70_004981 [Coemansia sp. RSA 2708]KAJ2312489.1 hypothetical protein IWW54_002056 [Coemansia sp. RSA 2705]KAJ2319793.1 hypothetical protein IWW52_001762 [Coemansia sp. RSA 2704]KAJ2737706.1 hypothetical protein H4R23_001657 [Coemansia sp. Cherry 401B]